MATREYLLGNVAVRGTTGATGATGPTGASAFQTVTIQPAPAGGSTETEFNLASLISNIIGEVVLFRLQTTIPGDVLWSQIFHMGTSMNDNRLYKKAVDGNDERILAQTGDVTSRQFGPGISIRQPGAPDVANTVTIVPGDGQWGIKITNYTQSLLLFSAKAL